MATRTSPNVQRSRDLQEWERLVADCSNSGMKVSEWCASQGITPSMFYKKRQQVLLTNAQQPECDTQQPGRDTEQPVFAQLPAVMPETVQADKYNIIATLQIGDAHLDVYSGASGEIVTAICQVLAHVK